MEEDAGTLMPVSGSVEKESALPRPASPVEGTVKYFLGDAVRRHFEQYGHIAEATVMRDRLTGEARGFGFVCVAASAAPQVESAEHIIGGRKIDLKRSLPHPKKTRKLFVGGLGAEVHNDMLKEYFEQFGVIDEAQVMFDHTTGRSRGFGFITFDDDSAVDRVFGVGHMHSIGGKQVEVKPATPRGSGPQGAPIAVRYPAAVMGQVFSEMGAMAARFPSGAYPGMMPYGPGAPMTPMGMYSAMGAQGMGGYSPYGAYAMMLQQQQQQQQQQLMQQQQMGAGGMRSPFARPYGGGGGGSGSSYERGPYGVSAALGVHSGALASGAYAYGFKRSYGESDQSGQLYAAAYQQSQLPQASQRQQSEGGWASRDQTPRP